MKRTTHLNQKRQRNEKNSQGNPKSHLRKHNYWKFLLLLLLLPLLVSSLTCGHLKWPVWLSFVKAAMSRFTKVCFQCWKFPQVRQSEADSFFWGPGTFCWFFFNFYCVYDLRFKAWGTTTFWLSFKHCLFHFLQEWLCTFQLWTIKIWLHEGCPIQSTNVYPLQEMARPARTGSGNV